MDSNKAILPYGEAIQTKVESKIKESPKPIILFLEGGHFDPRFGADEHWIAKCPTIMAQHYVDVFQYNAKRFSEGYPQILIDFSEMLDRRKVNSGAELALKIFIPESTRCEIFNVCFWDSEGKMYSIDTFQQDPCK